MVAKPQIEDGTRNRAGMPLARAQRLTAKAQSTERASAMPKVMLGCIMLTALAGGGFVLQDNLARPTDGTVSVVAADTDQVPVIEDIQTASSRMQTGDDVLAAAPTPRPVLAPCLSRIESDLTALQQANAQAMAWDVKRNRIRAAAQSALNCEFAGVSFEGDFELTATDFADLHVAWDRAAGSLAFTIVDSVTPDASPLVLTDDGQPIEFIVH